MAKDEPTGLLSKVVKFVRHPTTDWTKLSDVESDREDAQNKQQLKEMLERKRRNDFVRRREFDQLRKRRGRAGRGQQDASDRASTLQSSVLTSRLADERASTLKKIDEIEEQMSQQWWANHQDAVVIPKNVAGATGPGHVYAVTQPAGLQDVNELAMSGAQAAADPMAGPGWKNTTNIPTVSSLLEQVSVAGGLTEYDPRAVFDLSAPVFVHDPDLEEAAIRFANGDVAGAEANLLEMLDMLAAAKDQQPIWMALFDLYRATGLQQKFEVAALDYAVRFDRLAPLWFSFPESLGSLVTQAAGQGDKSTVGFHWTAPATLGVQSIAALNKRLTNAQAPWCFDWTALKSIDVAALDMLTEQLMRWSTMPVRLRFAGLPVLMALLQEKTPTGDSSVASSWWKLRLEVLRITGNSELFDLTALEYCVTYEVSPPSWAEVSCEYISQEPEDARAGPESFIGVLPSELSMFHDYAADLAAGPTRSALVAELAGQLTGDSSDALSGLEVCEQKGMLVVTCDKLARVDFAAAGSILNWVAARQADGCEVVFHNLHRLVAVFFNVIGINEYARVMPRKD